MKRRDFNRLWHIEGYGSTWAPFVIFCPSKAGLPQMTRSCLPQVRQ
jgi:hypothetical protein